MRTKIFRASLFLIIAPLLSFAFLSSEGPHGGVVKLAEDHYIEMKNNPDTSFYTYLLDKKMKTMSSKGVSGQVKFFFSDSTAQDVQLKPIEGNGFTAHVAPGFYRCTITYLLAGKSLSATFDKENQIVEKK